MIEKKIRDFYNSLPVSDSFGETQEKPDKSSWLFGVCGAVAAMVALLVVLIKACLSDNADEDDENE